MTIQVATYLNIIHHLSLHTRIPANELLAKSGLQPADVADLAAQLPWEYGTDIFTMAYKLTGNAHFGLSVGMSANPMTLGQELGMFLQICPDFRTLLREFVEFSALMGEMVRFIFFERRQEAKLQYKALTVVRRRDFNAYRGTVEVNAAAVVTLTRLLTLNAVRILRLEFDFPGSPALEATYRRAFGDGISLAFDCPFSGVVFAVESLELRNPYFQESTFNALKNDLQARLRHYRGAVTLEQMIHSMLEERYFLPREPELSLEMAAAGQHVSPRQLQRTLKAKGRTFHAIRNDVKRYLAARFLVYKTNRELADLLKFADTPAFIRWYRAQFGMPPERSRQQAAQGQRGA